MDGVTKRLGKDAGVAVIRSFAPARIERELLAQAFEIVQQSATIGDEDAQGSRSTVAPPSESTNNRQLLLREPAA